MELSDYKSLLSERGLMMKDYLRNQLNLLQWLSLITVTFLLLRQLLTVFNLWAQAYPPSHSFYGHRRLFSRTNLTCLLSKLHEEYGPVVKLWLGPIQLLVSIKDPELIKPMPSKGEDKSPLTGRVYHLSFGQTSFSISSINEIMLDPGTRSESKLMIDDCIFYHLPNPKVALVKWEKWEIEVHHV